MECQDDVLAVSGMAEDIRDALIDYQVGGAEAYAAGVIKIGLWQISQQRAIYDQNCKLIVGCQIWVLLDNVCDFARFFPGYWFGHSSFSQN